MKINFEALSSIPSIFDDETHELLRAPDITIEETAVRLLKDMKELFLDASGMDDQMPLYYMYNGIYREAHKELFKKNHIRYEYTVLLPTLINGEMMKAHGHIHGLHPIKKARHIEAYEVLHGTGFFELFMDDGDTMHVIMLKVKPGDYLIIPSGYYHLSINTGTEPFIFGDLIIDDANSEYGYLKEMKGAPVFVMSDEHGHPEFKMNEHYNKFDVRVQQLNVDEVSWENPVLPIPLYAHFIANPDAFSYLK